MRTGRRPASCGSNDAVRVTPPGPEVTRTGDSTVEGGASAAQAAVIQRRASGHTKRRYEQAAGPRASKSVASPAPTTFEDQDVPRQRINSPVQLLPHARHDLSVGLHRQASATLTEPRQPLKFGSISDATRTGPWSWSPASGRGRAGARGQGC